jgi:hypothetical protein
MVIKLKNQEQTLFYRIYFILPTNILKKIKKMGNKNPVIILASITYS